MYERQYLLELIKPAEMATGGLDDATRMYLNVKRMIWGCSLLQRPKDVDPSEIPMPKAPAQETGEKPSPLKTLQKSATIAWLAPLASKRAALPINP